MNLLTKIYTKKGDAGETSLYGEVRCRKSDLRIQAIGEIDELNAILGVARAHSEDGELSAIVSHIQEDLFTIGAQLASVKKQASNIHPISEDSTVLLENYIDNFDKQLEPLRNFILPGGGVMSSYLHLARSVCRRAERTIVELSGVEPVESTVLAYLNRLSDLLFVMARVANQRRGIQEIVWNVRDKK